MKKLSCAVAFLALLCAPVSAAVFGDGFGVNVKNERITPAELAEIAASGIKRVRISISWYAVEQQAGQYRWDIRLPRRTDADDYATRKDFTYDELLSWVARAGLKADTTLHEGNAGLLGLVNIAAPGKPAEYRHAAPHSDAQLRQFAAFAGATAKHFAKIGDVARWHIWNEPDTDGGFPPKTNAAEVGKLAAYSCQAIREVAPKASVMGVALGAYGDGDLRYDFMAGMFAEANPLACLNGFSVHPYRSAPPETAAADYARVRKVLAPYQPVGKAAVPVTVDEWGYSINKSQSGRPVTQRWRTWTEQEQAALMLRAYLTNLQSNIPLTVAYEWRDSCTNPNDWECNFGAKAYDGSDKAAARMFRYVWPALNGRPFVWAQPVAGCSGSERLQRFGSRNGDGMAWTLVWTYGAARKITIDGKLVKATDIFGADIQPATLTGSPLMLQHKSGENPAIRCAQ